MGVWPRKADDGVKLLSGLQDWMLCRGGGRHAFFKFFGSRVFQVCSAHFPSLETIVLNA
jgi:hypothetical protein